MYSEQVIVMDPEYHKINIVVFRLRTLIANLVCGFLVTNYN
jgi:hypothetical protein